MSNVDWDDDDVIERWCVSQRLFAERYLALQPVKLGALGEWPAWHVAPFAALWAVESVVAPGRVGWWVISGDLPTDYTSGAKTPDPRSAIAMFAGRWADLARTVIRGEGHGELTIGADGNSSELGPLLAARAEVLNAWVQDDAAWET